MTTTFYVPPERIQGKHVFFPEEEARHLVRVLRHRSGDEVVVVDGAGRRYRVQLEEVTRSQVTGVWVAREEEVHEPEYELVLGMGLLKKMDRFEMVLEKAVECGVRRIIPLITHRTEKKRLRMERARHIMVAAMKQSGRSRLPELSAPTPLEEVLAQGDSLSFAGIAHERTLQEYGFCACLKEANWPRRLGVLIGPEGGFTEDEVKAASRAGWQPVWLGNRRLRAETAAIAVCASVMICYETGKRRSYGKESID